MPDAVVFDLDGVLLDSEQRWNEAKEALVREAGARWRDEAPTVMMGMSSPEWAAYLRDELGVAMDARAISRDVVRRMQEATAASCRCCPARSRRCARSRSAGRSAWRRRRTARTSTSCSSRRASPARSG